MRIWCLGKSHRFSIRDWSPFLYSQTSVCEHSLSLATTNAETARRTNNGPHQKWYLYIGLGCAVSASR